MAANRECPRNSLIEMNIPLTTQMTSESVIVYMLLACREELRRLKKRNFELCKSKLNLTHKLESDSMERIAEHDMDNLANINREISYTRRLMVKVSEIKNKMERQMQLTQMKYNSNDESGAVSEKNEM